MKDLRSRLYSTMLNQEPGWYDQKGTGELVNRLSNDTTLVGNSLSQNLSDGLRSIITIAAVKQSKICLFEMMLKF